MKSFIIDRLIEIEEGALSLSNDIREKEQNLPVMIQRKCAEIEQGLKSEYEREAKEVRKQKEQEAESKISEIQKDSEKRFGTLNEYFKINHMQWEDEIITNITKRQ